MPETFRFGEVTVEITAGLTLTLLPDGSIVPASHEEQEGQAETAARYGLTVEELNGAHDLAHSLLSHMLGLDASPTLKGVASRQYWPHWHVEEQAVLVVQAFAKAAGVDLMEVARRWSKCA